MTESRFSIDKPQPFKFPVSMYYLARFFHNHPKFNLKLSNWESKLLRKKIENLKVDKPVYVTGLARAGSTVTVEMIGKHPDVAYHKYMHSVNPFIPHLVQQISKVVPLFKKPVERVHKDGLMVNRDSPEAVEEPMWMRFFDTIHNDKVSNIFDEKISNPEFEKTYDLILRKLMYNQKSTRYVAKNNYNVSRLEYLHKLYPSLKIILLIRHPINHIASLVKQDAILTELEIENKRLLHWTKIIGHREFASAKICVNVDSTKTIEKIRKLWEKEETYVKGWAVQWNMIYSYVTDLLKRNKHLAERTLILRYEDLTDKSAESIDRIVEHLELSEEKFKDVKEEYIEKLQQPKYYKPSFSKKELEDIRETTKDIAKLYGYD